LVANVLERYVQGRSACLDLGAGNLRDSKFMLAEGFRRVVAVDSSPDSQAFRTEGIELHICPIERFEPEQDAFDFVFSCNALFYLHENQVASVFKKASTAFRRRLFYSRL